MKNPSLSLLFKDLLPYIPYHKRQTKRSYTEDNPVMLYLKRAIKNSTLTHSYVIKALKCVKGIMNIDRSFYNSRFANMRKNR